MVAINKNIWERLGENEELLFKSLLPFLSDVPRYKRNLKRLVKAVYKKSLILFPDIEQEVLPKSASESLSETRFKDPLAVYLQEVKSFGSTNRDEEMVLARALEVARLALNLEIAALPGFKNRRKEWGASISIPQIHELLEQAQDEAHEGSFDLTAVQEKIQKVEQRLGEISRIRTLLIEKNLHLVPNFAKRYRNLGVSYADLIQEGNTSLLRATDKFDWRRGVRFSTYAQWWIQQAMLKSLYSQSRVVRLPVYLNQRMKKIRNANQEAWGESGQNLSPEEMAKSLKEPVGRIRRAMKASVGTYSLDQDASNREDFALRDLLVDRQQTEIQDLPEGPGLNERIAEILGTLPEKERKILVLRFGLEGNAPHTLDEVSKFFRVSRERIRQIQVQALKKLHTASKKKQLGSFLS